MRRRGIAILWPCAAALGLLLAPAVHAGSLTLSDFSSNHHVQASDLDATFTFEVTGNTVTLTVTNQTSGDKLFNIQQVFFNTPDDVGSLTLASGPSGWHMDSGRSAGKFGKFDIALFGEGGRNGASIAPGSSEVWTFTFSGNAANVDQSDFITEIARKKHPKVEAIAAARFIGEPGNGNAWGAAGTPAPGGGSAG